MLSLSDTNIQEASALILAKGYDVAFIVPTPTGLKKSIMDAHHSIRALLKRNEIHDFFTQKQGTSHKVITKGIVITNRMSQGILIDVDISFYRPETKSGDPRLWIYKLTSLGLAEPGNLIAIIAVDQRIYIVNCSNQADLQYALAQGLPRVKTQINPIATELLHKILVIHKQGFIPTITKGDTGVGMTLEAELGITANASKKPDYKGIELKASRINNKGRSNNRSQLFSKVPNWKLSPIKSAANLINRRGYVDPDGRSALYHTMNGQQQNSLGLFLDIDYANDYLRQMYISNNGITSHDTTWLLQDLKAALLKKHKETFWVKARHNNDRNAEKFHYVEVEHTANPYIDKWETLIETGLITLDYTMHVKPTGGVRDHGYLFKLHQNGKPALFPEPVKYDLAKM